ncbi:MAG: 50S ribosomal protein L22 [Candidatus Woesearchaeota archaeon]
MKTKYAFQGMKENMARAITKDAEISTKVSIEIANFLRGRTSVEAKVILERVLKKKQPIPFKRFTDGVGHRKGAGIAAGRFPEKASEVFLTIIKQCEANALAKGLSEDLRIVHLVPQRGSNTFRHGRQRRRTYKRTHLEIVLEEFEPVKVESKKSVKSPAKKVTSKKVDADVGAKSVKAEAKKADVKAESKSDEAKEKKTVTEADAKVKPVVDVKEKKELNEEQK